MKIIDYPIKFPTSDYQSSIDNQVEQLSKLEHVVSVYQIGSVSTPGISDIDMLVVFENNQSCLDNPRGNNTPGENYLFTHTLYGCSKDNFIKSFDYTFFHNHKLLFGHEFNIVNNLDYSDQKKLKQQIALEFLVKMYVNLVVQKAYNTIKLRSLFLHIKALIYDFEFLEINPEQLIEIINEGLYFRNNWFSEKFSKPQIVQWFDRFFVAFESFLNDILKTHKLYVQESEFRTAPNIKIVGSDSLNYNRKGLVVGNYLNVFGEKYFKVLNRLNNFEVFVNCNAHAPELIQMYFDYVDQSRLYNRTYLPYYMSLTSSLNVYKN